ncbi:aspartate dehydrogenase domain-containing protein [Lachnospiraceae bacterium 54-53]
MNKLRLGILGNGYLGGIIAKAWRDGLLPEYELVGIAGRTREKTDALAAENGCRSCAGVDELLELKPDYIAEAASVEAVRDWAEKILSNGSNFIVLSIGAFADRVFYERVKETAAEHRTRVYIASGAVGGFDVLRTLSLMGETVSGIETRKGPGSLRGTSLFEERLMMDEESAKVFEGNAKEAIDLLPTRVNVAVAASLATTGPERTGVDIYSVPGMVGDDHKITAETDGVKAVVDIYSSTSAIAGWSVVAVLQNIVSPVVF